MELPSDRRDGHAAHHHCCTGIDFPPWVRDADLSLLTSREREVLSALGECLPNSVIAGRWHVAERTVKKHVAGVFSKLEISSRAQAAVIANYRKCLEQCPSGH